MTEKSVDRDPIERLADSFVNRLRAGEYPSISEYRAKYPELANAIPELLPALAELERNASVDSSAHSVVGSQLQLNAPRQLGEYTILQEIGRGGMGVVYEAVQESLGRHVALKVLSTAGLNGTQLDRFRLEACAAARLHHTNIVPVFGVGEDQGLHYYAMQFISGHSLDLVIKEISRLRQNSTASSGPGTGAPQAAEQAEAKAVSTSELISSSEFSTSTVDGEFYRSVGRVGLQAAEALAYAHSQGVLHRDIKPSNLLLDARGSIWITDFGLAKTEGTDGLTHTGDIIGTLRYMAPERFDGWSDPRSDVYGLGVTLYELVALRPLFGATARGKLVENVLHESPVALRKCDPRVPRDLETIIDKALSKEPRHRYAGAQQMADDLRLFLDDRTICARRNTKAEQFWRWCRRNPALASVTTALLVAIVVGFAAVTWKWRDAERARQNEKVAREEANWHAKEVRLGHERLKEASKLVELGTQFTEIHGWDDAELSLSQAITLCPELASGWEKRADLYFRLGLFDLAASDFQQVFERQRPVFAKQWFRQAALRLHTGDTAGYHAICDRMNADLGGSVHVDSAINVVRTCVLADRPFGEPAHWVNVAEKVVASQRSESFVYVLGCAYLRAGEFEQAVSRCRESLDLNENWDARAINFPILAIAYYRLGQTDNACQALTAASVAREQWIARAYTLKRLWIVDGGATSNWPIDQLDWLEFEMHYREACAVLGLDGPSDDPRLRVLRARAFASLRHGETADQEYQTALRMRPDDRQIHLESHRNAASHFVSRENFEQAAAEFAEAMRLESADNNLWKYLAVAQLAAGDVDSYRDACAGMFERFCHDSDRRVLHNLVWTCTLHPQSLPEMTRLITAAQEGAKWWIDSERVLVAAYYRLGQYDDAVNSLHRLSRVSRLQPTVLLFGAMAHYRLGHDVEARRELAEATSAIVAGPIGSSPQALAPGVDPRDWADKVAERLLRKEAEALILDSGASTVQESQKWNG